MARYIYAHNAYKTVADVEKAVTAFKARLDNNPTDWCGVKLVTKTKLVAIHSPAPDAPLEPDGSDVPRLVKSSSNIPIAVETHDYGEPLNDEEIKNLVGSNQNFYNVFAVHDGDNHTYVSEPEAINIISNMRASYAKWKQVDKYYDTQVSEGEDNIEINVSNEDMTKYVS